MIEVTQIYGGDYNEQGRKRQYCCYQKNGENFIMTFVSDYRKDVCDIHVSKMSDSGVPSYLFDCGSINNAELIVTKELVVETLEKYERMKK